MARKRNKDDPLTLQRRRRRRGFLVKGGLVVAGTTATFFGGRAIIRAIRDANPLPAIGRAITEVTKATGRGAKGAAFRIAQTGPVAFPFLKFVPLGPIERAAKATRKFLGLEN